MKNKITKYLAALLLVAGVTSGCDNFLSPSVDQNRPTATVIQSTEDLQAVVDGGYDYLNDLDLYGRDFYVAADVMSDNAWSNANSGRFDDHDQFQFTLTHAYIEGIWSHFYEVIGTANLAINADISGDGVEDIKGEAYAMRAFSHMNLLLAYGQQYVNSGNVASPGGVPYVTTYNNPDEFAPSRDAVSDVWSNIEADLDSAVTRLDPASSDPTKLDYWAARALQTRYYLYTEQYDQVVTVAEDIINNGINGNNDNYSITEAGDLESTWRSGSGPSSLFEVAFVDSDALGTDNISRIYRPTSYGDVSVSEDLYTAHDSLDVRRDLYGVPGESVETLIGPVDSLSTYRMLDKYSDETGSDNVRVIRYAEVILNYAEALANGASGEMSAVDALNMLASERYENGSPYTGSVTVDEVLAERRLELAMEGHRLYDLLRTERDIPGNAESPYRTNAIPYGDYRTALPIPDAEIRANSSVDQNAGY